MLMLPLVLGFFSWGSCNGPGGMWRRVYKVCICGRMICVAPGRSSSLGPRLVWLPAALPGCSTPVGRRGRAARRRGHGHGTAGDGRRGRDTLWCDASGGWGSLIGGCQKGVNCNLCDGIWDSAEYPV